MSYPVPRVKKVIKRDGRVVDFDASRIENAVKKAMISVGKYNKESLRKVVQHVLKVVNEKFGEAETYPHVEEIQDIVELALVKYGLYEVAKAYILYRRERENIRKEKMILLEKDYVDEVDKKLSLNAIRLIVSRYLLRNEQGKLIEDPKGMFKRVAALVVIPDILHDNEVFSKEGNLSPHPFEQFNFEEWCNKVGLGKNSNGFTFTWNKHHLERMKALYDELNNAGKMKVPWSKFWSMLLEGKFEKYCQNFHEYYNLMVEKRFLPNSPTLFNAGARLSQLSACFVLDVDDSIDSIMDTAKDAALIFKSGGGVGINFSKLRPEGDTVFSTGGVASGPTSFMQIIDKVTDVIKQGGKRRGANMGILEIWHPDIEKFIASKGEEGKLVNYNLSVLVTPDFWKYYEEGKPYPLRNPRDGKVWKEVNPKTLFHQIAQMAWRTGDPGVIFLDHINRRNILKKALGEIRTTNPCISKETRVLTPDGWKTALEIFDQAKKDGNVNKIVIGDKEMDAFKISIVTMAEKGIVYQTTHNEVLELIKPKTVEAWILCTGSRRGFKIETEEGYEITVTPEHRFLTLKGWKEAKDLEVGDQIVLGRLHPYYVNQTYKGEINLDPDIAFALGWLVGDGGFNKHYVAWYLGPNDKMAEERIRRGIEKLGGNPHSHTYTLSVSEYKIQYNSSTKVYKELVRLLGDTIEKERDRIIPKIVWKLSLNTLTSFLKGLFTADGYVDNDKAIRLTSSSLKLLKEVQVLLTTLGIYSRIYRRPYTKQFTYNAKDGSKRVYKTKEYYELIINGYSRKIFKELISFENNEKQEKLILDNIKRDPTLAEIKSIKEVEENEFYDFIVPEYNNYIANGLINHNCGEEPLYPYESCNLGSINVYAFVREDNTFDWDEFRKTVAIALSFLDNIIDVNKYPTKKIEDRTKRSRKVGLGFMGLSDALFALRIPYNSEEGFAFIRTLTENLTYYAMKASIERAKERGVFPLYEKSAYVDGEMPFEGYYKREIWTLDWNKIVDEIKVHGIRNAEVTTVAPTGSISMIFDVSSGIEPQFALVYEKRVTVGRFFYVDIEFEKALKERGLYDEKILKKVADNGGSLQDIDEIPEDMKKIFLVAYDIPWWDHIRAQAEAQTWICASISKTVNMPKWVTVEDVEKAYLFGYKIGLKSLTIYRDTSKSIQVLVTPSQRQGTYATITENKTIDIMKNLGIDVTNILGKKVVEETLKTYRLLEEPKLPTEEREAIKNKKKLETCQDCGSRNLIFQDDCIKCLDCGWVACPTS
ncbi:MAG: adenosylcobalamin-dependent ribonucleoside-diphosphate reductase [Nitrososphaeria archaeon]|nr:adenosylcobalamin-dependent ribonucleoside-diphosphate reductase [Nitrososphaeria archaeon]